MVQRSLPIDSFGKIVTIFRVLINLCYISVYSLFLSQCLHIFLESIISNYKSISRLFFLDFSASSMCSVSSHQTDDESRPPSPCRDELNQSNVPSAVAAASPPQNATSADGAVESAAAIAQNQCFTVCQPLRLHQEWTISNFAKSLDLATPGFCMQSEHFRHESMPWIRWQLCLYPGGKREENRGNVSLYLKMSASHINKLFTVRAEYHFHFVDEQGLSNFANVNIGDFKMKPSSRSHSWGIRNITRDDVKRCIWPDQSLHIICYVELLVPRELGGSKVEQQCSAAAVGSPNCPACKVSNDKANGVELEVMETDSGLVHVQKTRYGVREELDNDDLQAIIEMADKQGLVGGPRIKTFCQDELITRLSSNVGAAAISGDDEGHVCGQCGQRVPNKNSIL